VLTAGYDIIVSGVQVTRANANDVLGDGTVYYDANNNILTFDNAIIDSKQWDVYSRIDLIAKLIGENKIVCRNDEYIGGIYAGDNYLGKDT